MVLLSDLIERFKLKLLWEVTSRLWDVRQKLRVGIDEEMKRDQRELSTTGWSGEHGNYS